MVQTTSEGYPSVIIDEVGRPGQELTKEKEVGKACGQTDTIICQVSQCVISAKLCQVIIMATGEQSPRVSLHKLLGLLLLFMEF